MTKNAPSLTYQELFDNVKLALPGRENAALRCKREEALAYFIQHGFPKASREEWKYTRLGVFLPSPLALAEEKTITRRQLEPFLIENLNAYHMVFVNGRFNTALSDKNIPYITTLASSQTMAQANAGDEIEALNLAFMRDGLSIRFPKATALDKPIHVIHIATGGASYIRNHIHLGEGSVITVIESYVSLEKNKNSLSNVVTEITLEHDAGLEHYVHQLSDSHAHYISSSDVILKQSAKYNSYSLTNGGTLSRHTISVDMQEELAVCNLLGVYLGKDRQHIDHYIPVRHSAPNCTSRQAYRGILSGTAKGVFYGKVVVPQDAQKTDAHQSNHNLLLSDTAMAYSRPELEIHADDVKCSHGSATGALDKNAMFYLQSRGIDRTEAQALLVEGFVGELLEEMPWQSLKHYWQGALRLWLKDIT